MPHIPGNPAEGHQDYDPEDIVGISSVTPDTQGVTLGQQQGGAFTDYDADEIVTADGSPLDVFGWNRIPPREQPWYGPINNYMEGFTGTFASGVQNIFNLGRAGHQAIWGGDVVPWLPNYDKDDPIAGADAINDLLVAAKMLPDTTGGFIHGGATASDAPVATGTAPPIDPGLAHMMGQETAWNVGAYGVAGGMARATGITYGWLEPLIQFVRARPMTALLTDIGISFLQGGGAYLGRESEAMTNLMGREAAESTGRVLGASSLLPVAAATSGYRGAVNLAQNLGLTKKIRTGLAGESMRGVMTPEQIATLEAGTYETPTVGGPFTTGEILNAGGLSRLRQSIIGQSERAREVESGLIRGREDDLVLALQSLRTDPMQTEARIFIARKIEASIARIKAAEKRAIDKANQRVALLAPGETVDSASKMAREELDTAFEAARASEREIWSKIGNGRFNTDAIVRRAKDIIDDTPRLSGEGGKPDVPVAILEIAGKDAVLNAEGEVVQEAVKSTLRTEESVIEISALSSRINRDIRQAIADGKPNLARQLGELRDAIYDDIVPVTGDAIGLAEAREYSRLLNDKFTRGSVGKLLGYDARGGVKVEPEATLSKVISRGINGKIGVEKLRAASEEMEGGTANIDRLIQEHLKNMFAQATMRTGDFNPNAANSFVINNPALELFPELRAQMLDARIAGKLAKEVKITSKTRVDNIRKQNIASQVINADVGLRAAAILGSKNPIRDANYLMRLAARDTSGTATIGVKSAFYDLMMDRLTIMRPSDGTKKIDLGQAMSFINNKTNRQVIKIMYGEHGLRLLDSIMKGLQYQVRGRTAAAPFTDVIGGGLTKEFIGNFGTVMGARLGGNISGSSLLGAGMGKRHILRMYNAIVGTAQDDVLVMLQKALEDPEFAKTLLTPMRRATPSTIMSLEAYGIVKEILNLSAASGVDIMQGNNLIQ